MLVPPCEEFEFFSDAGADEGFEGFCIKGFCGGFFVGGEFCVQLSDAFADGSAVSEGDCDGFFVEADDFGGHDACTVFCVRGYMLQFVTGVLLICYNL